MGLFADFFFNERDRFFSLTFENAHVLEQSDEAASVL